MKKLFLVLASLTLLPTLTSYGITDNQKYILGLGIVVAGGTAYYLYGPNSAPAVPAPQEETAEEVAQRLEKQRKFKMFVKGTQADDLLAKEQEKQTEPIKEPAPQVSNESDNKPVSPILSPKTPTSKPNLNNPLPPHKQSSAPQNTIPVTKEDNFSYSFYCERVSEIGWDY